MQALSKKPEVSPPETSLPSGELLVELGFVIRAALLIHSYLHGSISCVSQCCFSNRSLKPGDQLFIFLFVCSYWAPSFGDLKACLKQEAHKLSGEARPSDETPLHRCRNSLFKVFEWFLKGAWQDWEWHRQNPNPPAQNLSTVWSFLTTIVLFCFVCN